MKQRKKVYIAAEVAQAHDGSLGLLHSYVDAIAKTGADAAKFQIHIAEAESSAKEPFRVRFSYKDKTRYDYWNRMSFSKDEWRKVKQHCQDLGLGFIASPFSIEAAKLLGEIGVKTYKIASGQIDDFLMLDFIKKTRKEIWISTGMSSFNDIEKTLKFLGPARSRVVLFQCSTQYPTAPENVGLNVIGDFTRRYRLPVGYSDHSGNIFASLAAVTMGADHLESHIVFDKKMFGPDASSSLTVEEFITLVQGVRFLEKALSQEVDKNKSSRYKGLKTMFGKTLAVNRDITRGEKLLLDDLASKKPAGQGIASCDYMKVIGKTSTRDIKAGTFLKKGDVRE